MTNMKIRILYILLITLVISVMAACNNGTNAPSEAMRVRLPHSMKGYELYSWQEKDQWHFTLITGTNRIKTLEEITSGGDNVTQGEWAKMHVLGVDELKTVLGRLPKNEEILWMNDLWSGQAGKDGDKIILPPGQIIDVVKERCGQCGLDLHVNE